MRILVTGKSGQLGRSIHKLANTRRISKIRPDFTFVGREELDLCNLDNIVSYFAKNDFDIIINCAAYTSVDAAENQENIANQVNNIAVKKLAEICYENKSHLIHISTDYVFDGASNQPYRELDVTNPINIYGKTKLAGEKAVQDIMKNNATIIRTSWVYSEFGSNFVKTMLKLGKEREMLNVVSDQVGSPTYATDLAEVILQIVDNNAHEKQELPTEIYHYSNQGKISWYDFAKEIFKLAKIHCMVQPIATKRFVTIAKRPKNSSMSKDKIHQKLGVESYSWVNSLDKVIQLLKTEQD
jgi:dTDP-4-dehydrorhamnose reductase